MVRTLNSAEQEIFHHLLLFLSFGEMTKTAGVGSITCCFIKKKKKKEKKINGVLFYKEMFDLILKLFNFFKLDKSCRSCYSAPREVPLNVLITNKSK